MGLEDQLQRAFNTHIDGWNAHCNDVAHVSDPNVYLDCDSYRGIVKMGKEALPMIENVYRQNPEMRCTSHFPKLITEIVGDVNIPKESSGQIHDMRLYFLGFLEGYRRKL